MDDLDSPQRYTDCTRPRAPARLHEVAVSKSIVSIIDRESGWRLSHSCRRAIGTMAILSFSLVLALPAHAVDPLTLLLLRALRDHAISSSIESLATRKSAPVVPPAPIYGTLDDRQLRGLIDEGFIHLTSEQRAAVYTEARKILHDPKHVGSRALMIEELASKASAMREVHERFRALSGQERRELVALTRSEYQKMGPAERQEMLAVLRGRQLPIPRDLADMMLSALPETLPGEPEQARN
jgi:hypothetical protein